MRAYVNAGGPYLRMILRKGEIGDELAHEIENENAPTLESSSRGIEWVVIARYFLSFGYLDQEGIVGGKDKSDYKRYSLRFNNTYNVFENKANKFFRSFKGRYEPRIHGSYPKVFRRMTTSPAR